MGSPVPDAGLEAKLRETPQAPFHGFVPPKHFGAGGKRERLGHIRLSNKLGLSARAGRTLAARRDSATMDRACRSCPNDPQSHIVLHRRRSVAAHGAKKEYTFHIDLGIEFLFHSVDPE